jgi:serine/threonine-protein kinase
VQTAVQQAWDLASRASRLEGEVASHTRKLEALERRGRALRAEIGRKVEELAHEESRVLRDSAAAHQDAARLREQLQVSERNASTARAQADQAMQQAMPAPQMRQVFERAGAAAALVDARREQLSELEQKAAAKDGQARELRRQIEELRAQLSRYAEALEEDLVAHREKVAQRTRDGLSFEKSFSDVSALLINHLKAKPEVRDLLQELVQAMQGQNQSNRATQNPESRVPS